MKKRILISPEQSTAQTGAFFQELGFELCSSYDKNSEYQFIVDDYLKDVVTLPRIQTKSTLPKECEVNVRAVIDEKNLNMPEVKKLLGAYFSDAEEFDLVDRYSEEYKNIYTLKIHDYLNVGYFIDTIVVEAYKYQFDFEQIRNYLSLTLYHALKMVEKEGNYSPLEVSFSHSSAGFAVQISYNASLINFKSNLILAKEFVSKTNYFDLSYFEKRTKVNFSAFWFKEEALRSTQFYFLTEVSARRTVVETPSTIINQFDAQTDDVRYEPKKPLDQAKKLQLARKFSLFIKNLRAAEENPIESSRLTVEDVDQYLAKYPRQDALAELDLEVKNFVLKMISDDALYNGVTDYVQKIAQSNLDSHVEEIQRILGEKSLEDIAEIIRVKGNIEAEDDKVVVKGWSENANEDEWIVKRTELIDQIKEEVTVIKSQGRNVIEDDILRVVSNQLQANPEDVKTVVKGIVEEVVASEVLQKENLEQAFTEEVKPAPAFDAQKEKLEAQVVRMKKVMEQMKAEIVKLRTEKAEHKPLGDFVPADQSAEILDLKKTLGRALETMKSKEKIAVKAKSDFEQILQAKEEKMQSLEARLEQMKDEFSRSKEFANEEKLEQLQSENKSLNARLELANRKINIISQNMDKQDTDIVIKKEKEILTLKTNIQMAQSMIEKFKHERLELESRLEEEKEKFTKLKEEKTAAANPVKDQEREALLASLTNEKKILEEKLKLQTTETKKVEQKLKFTTAQLEESQRKKAAPANASAKSNEAYIKQLESANARIAETTNDLTDKKKEIHKLKQENMLLGSKLAELEKKLGNAEKKAS